MNNKQFTKLKVIKYYNPSNKVTVATPAMRALANAPSQLLEFNGGGQELAITLPYMCRNDLMPCHNDFVSEGLLHGLYYIYLAQNLIVADNSPMEVNFNVYIQCEPNFRFYGYSTRPVEFIKNIPSQPEQGIIPDPTQRKTETWAAESGDFANGVMNAPQEQDDTISSNPVDAIADHYSRLRPLVDIRPFIRRMYLALEKTTTLGEGTTPFFFPLSKFINEMPFVTSWGTDIRRRTIPLVSSMYYGHSVGFKLHMQFFPRRVEQNFTDIKNSIEPRIFYVPPGLKIEAPNSVLYPSTIYSQFPNIELYLNNNGMFSIPEITSQNQPTVDSNGAVNFEFVIPNITWFKFMGGIYKYLTERQIISTRTNVNTLANTDYGFLVVVFKVNTLQETTPGLMRIYVGLTDESRFGFHTIAPVFAISNEKQDIYMNDLNTHTEHYLPKSMYFGSGAL